MKPIRTQGLLLEPLTAAHADGMFLLLADPALYRYLDDAPPVSREVLRATYAKREAGRSPDGSQQWLNWIVFSRDAAGDVGGDAAVSDTAVGSVIGNAAAGVEQVGTPLGYVQATVFPDRHASIAYVLGTQYQGRGYARLAVGAMLDYLVAAHDVPRFTATVEADNLSSIRLLVALGFQQDVGAGDTEHTLGATERRYVR